MSAAEEQDLEVPVKRRQWLTLVLLVIVLYLVLPQLGGFRQGFTALQDANKADLLLSALLMLLTYFFAAGTYCLLASKRLHYGRTVLVQSAVTFVNRLLPAGIGGIGANYAYLRKAGHRPGAAGSIVAVNGLLGVIGHTLLVTIVVIISRNHLPVLHVVRVNKSDWFVPVIILLLLVAATAVFYFRERLRDGLTQVTHQLRYYRQRPLRLIGALLTSMGVTICTVSSLWYCTQAVNGGLSFVAVLLAFSFGLALGSATPTPGGLGGLEAALVAALVAYHMSSATALVAVLSYRFISYWSTLAIGAFSFTVVRKKGYL